MNTLYNSTVLITSFTFRIPAYYTSYYLSFTINSIFLLFFGFFYMLKMTGKSGIYVLYMNRI